MRMIEIILIIRLSKAIYEYTIIYKQIIEHLPKFYLKLQKSLLLVDLNDVNILPLYFEFHPILMHDSIQVCEVAWGN